MEGTKTCSGRQTRQCHINTKLLPIKAFYFTFLAGVGSLFPFVSIFMKQLGLTSTETGIIYGVMPFVCFFVRPLVGAIADRWLKHKAVLIVCTLLTALLHLLIILVPSRTPVSDVRVGPVEVKCTPNGSVMASCVGREVRPHGSIALDLEKKLSRDCSISLQTFTEMTNSSRGYVHNEEEDNDNSFVTSINTDNIHNNSTHISSSGYNTGPTTRKVDNMTILSSTASANDELNRETETDNSVTCKVSCSFDSADRHCSGESCHACFSDFHATGHPCKGILTDFYQIRLEFHTVLVRKLFFQINKQQSNISDGANQTCLQYSLQNLQFKDTDYKTMSCNQERTLQCEMSCESSDDRWSCVPESPSADLTFGLMFLLFFFASAAFCPIFSLADAAIFDLLGDQQHRYGQQRMWGTLGLAIFAITSTFVMNVMHDVDHAINYDVAFYLFAGLCTLSALLVSSMKISSSVRCQSMVKNACRLLVVPEVVVFLLVVMYLGMVSGTVEGFLFWYLADLGAGPLLFGFCLVVNCAFEIPFFFFSGAILARLGRMLCLYSAMFVLSIRLLAYSLLSNPWHVLFVETLHGVTFAVMWSAVTTHAHSIAPPGMSAATQGLVGGMNFGVGKGLGSLLTGLLFERIGARWTFRAYAMACLPVLAGYAALNTKLSRATSRHGEQHTGAPVKEPADNLPSKPFLQHDRNWIMNEKGGTLPDVTSPNQR